MVISISWKLWKEALGGNRDVSVIIRQILNCVEIGKHDLIFEKGTEIQEIISSQEFVSFSEILKAYAKKGFYQEQQDIVIRVTINNEIQGHFQGDSKYFDGKLMVQKGHKVEYRYIDISAVNSYLIQPLYIVVENKESDGYFVGKMYNHLTGEVLCTETKVKFEHGGGDTISTIVDSFSLPTRLICLIDSDKKYPNQDLSLNPKIPSLSAICERKYFDMFVLNKREIENYLPDDSIKKWLEKQKRKSELDHYFFNLNSLQKSYFDMKKGIKVKDFKEREVQDLFHELFISKDYLDHKHSDNKTLIDGFGRDVWKALEEVSAGVDEFSDSYNELKQLVGLIETNM
ncbi:hypothetical protein [Bacillus thuringiensis]|uniref:hypothetical protein n=1 Tax=Bacillus thuringiensis TaxID=1428 RepID=UPI003DA1B602